MPKTPSNKLFNLVNSLSGSEKRYFKLFVNKNQTGKDNKYILLFDAIDAQEIYDDEALRKIVYADQPIQSRKFSELKNYLYELILKSLQGYDEKTSVEYKLKGMLLSIKALFKRSHFLECKEMAQKTKKLAIKYEAFEHILQVLTWEKKIAYTQIDVNFLDKELDRIQAEEKQCLEQLEDLSVYQNLFFKVLISGKKNALLRTEDKKEYLQKLLNNPLMQDPEKAKAHRAKILFHRIKSICQYSFSDYEGFYQSGKKILEVMESKPHLLQEDVSEYISALSNFTHSCNFLNKNDEVENCLDKFLKIKPITIDDELKIHRQYYQNKFNLCLRKGDIEEAMRELGDHLKEVEKFDKELFERGSFYFTYFYIYFSNEDHEKALENLNEWLNLPRSVEREDLQSLARILNLVIHYEMNNTILLESLLRSTQRFLNKRDRMFKFEKELLGVIQWSMKARSEKELREAFVQLKIELENLSKIPSENAMFEYFNFSAWIDSKVNNKTFAETIRALYEKETTKELDH